MRAGPLYLRVAVQRQSSTPSSSGEPQIIWSTLTERWASKTALAGTERYGSEQLEAREQVEFRLRWSPDLADLHPADRLIEPAEDAGSPVPERSTYDIIAVHEIGRQEVLRVLAARRVVEA